MTMVIDYREEELQDVFSRYGLTMDTFPALPRLLATLGNPEPFHLESCDDFARYPQIFHRFFYCTADSIEGIAWVYGQEEAPEKLAKQLAALDDSILLISPENAVNGLMREARSELLVTVGWALLLVVATLLCFFKGIKKALLALIPTSLGLVTTIGVMGLLGVKINLINFIIMPILIGIGLDDGIHVIDRYFEQRDVRLTLATTGRSILLTTLTTCLGFGSLALADYHVLSGMGILTIVGVAACFFYSAMTLPAILQLSVKAE